MNAVEQDGLAKFFRHLPQAVALISVAVGVLVLLGWLFDMEAFKSILTGLTAMKANTALGFILSGIALWSNRFDKQNMLLRVIAQICSMAILLLGLLTFGEYLSGADLGIDQLLIRETTNMPGDIPGRMAFTTAISFAALGTTLLLLNSEKNVQIIAIHTLIQVPIVMAGSVLIDYSYDIEKFLRTQLDYTPMSIHTAMLFVLLSLGIVTARPDYPFRRFMTSDSDAGVTVRRLLPLIIVFPLVTGWLILLSYRVGYFDDTFALALFTATSITELATLILWNAGTSYKATIQREQAEENQHSAAQYARSLIEASLDPLVTINADGKITDVNAATEKATGRSRTELVGTDFCAYFTEPEKAREGYRQVFTQGFVTDYPLTIHHKDSRIIEVLYNASVYKDASGNVLGVFAAARDITVRKRAEEALRESEDKFRYLFEHSPVGKSITTPDGEIDVNPSFCKMLGYSPAELQHRKWQDLTHPDDIELNQRILDALLSGKQESARFIKRYLHKNGTVIWGDVSTALRRDASGKPLYFMTNVLDITEHKKAEEDLRIAHARLQMFVESNIVGIVIANSAGDIIEANDYYLNLIGYSRQELEQGQVDWRAITPPEWLPVDEQAIQELRDRGVCTPYEKEYVRRDGSRVAIFLADAMLPGPGEQIAAFVLDITARKQAESEMHNYKEHLEDMVKQRTGELEAANKDLEGFAYSVSHDLRVPLRAIDGYSHLLLKRYPDKLDDEGKRFLNVVRDNAKKMSQLIDDILAFSRMGRLGITASDVDMEKLAREVFEDLKPSLTGRELTLEIKPLPCCRGDQSMLRQVWINLLGNAVKFTRAKAPALIEVGGYTEEKENIYYVKDNGAGFDMQYADKLFGVFQRLHGVEEFEGTGIGLAIVKRIITRHGGRVWAEGKVDAGATIYFTLPT